MDVVQFKVSRVTKARMPLVTTLDYALRWANATETEKSQAFSRAVLTWENPSSYLPEATADLPQRIDRAGLTFLRDHHQWFGLPTLPPVPVAGLAQNDNVVFAVCPDAHDDERGAVIWTLLHCARLARIAPQAWQYAVLTSFPNLWQPDMGVQQSILLPWVNKFALDKTVPGGSIVISCALADCALYGEYGMQTIAAPDGKTMVHIPESVWEQADKSDFTDNEF